MKRIEWNPLVYQLSSRKEILNYVNQTLPLHIAVEPQLFIPFLFFYSKTKSVAEQTFHIARIGQFKKCEYNCLEYFW